MSHLCTVGYQIFEAWRNNSILLTTDNQSGKEGLFINLADNPFMVVVISISKLCGVIYTIK